MKAYAFTLIMILATLITVVLAIVAGYIITLMALDLRDVIGERRNKRKRASNPSHDPPEDSDYDNAEAET